MVDKYGTTIIVIDTVKTLYAGKIISIITCFTHNLQLENRAAGKSDAGIVIFHLTYVLSYPVTVIIKTRNGFGKRSAFPYKTFRLRKRTVSFASLGRISQSTFRSADKCRSVLCFPQSFPGSFFTHFIPMTLIDKHTDI